MQEVAVSLEPAQSGGEVKLNLEALQQEEDEPSRSLPIVRTSVLAVSPRQMPDPAPVETSEIQPALSPEHQASVKRTHNYRKMLKLCSFPFCLIDACIIVSVVNTEPWQSSLMGKTC